MYLSSDHNKIIVIHWFVNTMILQYHRGPMLQRGRGIGSVLAALVRNVTPAVAMLGKKVLSSSLVRDVGSTLANSAIQGGLNFATDALNGGNLKESANANLEAAKHEIAETVKRHRRPRVKQALPPTKRAKVTRVYRSRPGNVKSVFDEGTDDDDDDDDGRIGSS
jgi:hypothetical protein